ncbi:protease inhibitor I42 family protein [Candidatus Bipolaricaulota bacterium]|nr:protease inhibitor I42 family protein [Candidatus Bipolaricaulota bacterium]
MAKKLRLPVLLGIVISLALGSGGVAGSGSQVAMSVSSINGVVDVRIGGFVFERGSAVALEFMQDAAADCFGSDVSVSQLQLNDENGQLIVQVVVEPASSIVDWLGQIELEDSDGQPLPVGSYSLVVMTNVGTFSVDIEVVDPSRFTELGRYSATATICGLSLRVYRLFTEADAGAHGTLRAGDRLLVVLEGNPTTGYEWTNTLLYEFATLRQIGDVEFRPESGLIGAGGLFLFRYEAIAVGPQAFRFAYQRPWESAEPERLLEFSVDVH